MTNKISISKSEMRKLKTNLTKLQNLTLQKKTCFDNGKGFYSGVNKKHKHVLSSILGMFKIDDENGTN